MSATTTGTAPTPATASARTAWTGIAAAVAGAALATYGAYGDPHPKSNQEHAVPFLAGACVVVAALAFGLLVSRLSRPGASPAWRIGTGVVAVVLTPIVFWSGVPLVLGAAAALGGRRARSTAAVALGVIAIVASVLMAVLGNTVLSSS